MRIIAGTARGRSIRNPANGQIRPTADRVKEALFSIIASRIGNLTGIRVLDICAGTGNLGIEALSRGAAAAVFIERDRNAIQLVQTNLTALGFSQAAQTIPLPAERALSQLDRTNTDHFDLVLFDPPYQDQELTDRVLRQLGNSNLLAPTGLVVVEQGRRTELPDKIGRLARIDLRYYGNTTLHLYTVTPGAAPGEGEHA